jgi:hypothetical protein
MPWMRPVPAVRRDHQRDRHTKTPWFLTSLGSDIGERTDLCVPAPKDSPETAGTSGIVIHGP